MQKMTSMLPYDGLVCFLERLDTRCRYAVVKNPDLWASLRRGGDWDLLVSDLHVAQEALVESVGRPRRVAHRSYVVSHLYDWGQIDLLPRLVWQGIELIPRDRFLDRSDCISTEWPIACSAHQAIMGWIDPLLASRSFRKRYEPVVRDAAAGDAEELRFTLVQLFGERLAGRLQHLAETDRIADSCALVPRMRASARSRAYTRRPWQTSSGAVAFAYREALLRTAPCLPLIHLTSAATANAAGRWCAVRHEVVMGLVIFDGFRIQEWSSDDPTIRMVGTVITRGESASADRRALTLHERCMLASRQASGWLVASTVDVKGLRSNPSVLFGRPTRAFGQAHLLASRLDEYLGGRADRAIRLDTG